MKNTTLIFTLALFASAPLAADETTLRYQLVDEMQLTIKQEIFVGNRREPIAERKFRMTFQFNPPEGQQQTVTLEKFSASYTAHDMKQRLPTSHLSGKTFRIRGDGQSFEVSQSGEGLGLGNITDGNIYPSEIFTNLLPSLPTADIVPGDSWDSQRNIRSIEGWAFASGTLNSHHVVTGIDESNGKKLLQVKTTATASIMAAENNQGFIAEGSLEQAIDWEFDLNNGQLISLKTKEKASGINTLSQGDLAVKQTTIYQLKTKK
jgi:hypothetical protein